MAACFTENLRVTLIGFHLTKGSLNPFAFNRFNSPIGSIYVRLNDVALAYLSTIADTAKTLSGFRLYTAFTVYLGTKLAHGTRIISDPFCPPFSATVTTGLPFGNPPLPQLTDRKSVV